MSGAELALLGYVIASGVIGGAAAVLLFFGSWWWSSERWGALCFLLGWIPAFILAYLSFFIVGALWPLILVGYAFTGRTGGRPALWPPRWGS